MSQGQNRKNLWNLLAFGYAFGCAEEHAYNYYTEEHTSTNQLDAGDQQ